MINGRDNQSMPIGHLKRSVICQDGVNEWRINTTVRSTLTLPVVVAAKALSRDSEITLADIKLERRELTRDTPFIGHPRTGHWPTSQSSTSNRSNGEFTLCQRPSFSAKRQ